MSIAGYWDYKIVQQIIRSSTKLGVDYDPQIWRNHVEREHIDHTGPDGK